MRPMTPVGMGVEGWAEMEVPDMVHTPTADPVARGRKKIQRYAVAAVCLAVIGYIPFGLDVWYAYRPFGRWLMAHYEALILDKRPLLAHVLFAWFFIPWTLASLFPSILGLLSIRRHGFRLANEVGGRVILIWSWYACALAICLAIIRLVQLLLIGSWVAIY